MSRTYTLELRNLDGCGPRKTRVYKLPSAGPHTYWDAVTDIPCPCCPDGAIRWAEAGYVAGYRICDACGRHFLAAGDAVTPTLLRVGSRRSRLKGLRLA